jgi:GH15 family glucan-1,4-alpha-glucosidase
MVAQAIEDYALIGDCHSAALVGKNGSIDWLCLPRFDSDACFAALVGAPEHGHWTLAPLGGVRSIRRAYRPGTLVLETHFVTEDGEIAIIDFMPVRDEAPDVARIVVGIRGSVAVHMELVIRFGYGATIPWVHRISGGIQAVAGPDLLRLVTPVTTHGENLKTVADFTVREGDRVPFVLTWHPSHRPSPASVDAERELVASDVMWREWSQRYAPDAERDGRYTEIVRRSLLTLKGLTYAPSGGIVAAATTSLPERPGGTRNWDYRFCWLRDATFTLYALMSAGYYEEAHAWREWLLRAVAGTPAQIQTLYGLAGERRLEEFELSWLPGYQDARPVRIGNAASAQFQLDVYGEVIDAIHQAQKGNMRISHDEWCLARALVEFVGKSWQAPDEGIWEVRGPRRHFTHSKVMAWVALDRAVRAVEQMGFPGPLERWRALRDTIHADICQNGYDAELGAFVQHYGSKNVDANLLLIPLVGFLPASDPRVPATVKAIERQLFQSGFVYRYPTHPDLDGLPPGEGVFLACSFWLADNYCLLGRHREARDLFERLVGLTNDVGLLSEEYDPVSKRFLGNFPQAFSHVSLINTAHNLTRREGPALTRQEG